MEYYLLSLKIISSHLILLQISLHHCGFLFRLQKQSINVGDVPRLYKIKGFEDALYGFISTKESGKTAGFQNIYLWNYIKMPYFCQQDQNVVSPPQTVQALYPCSQLPFGIYNVIMIHGGAKMSDYIQGHYLKHV